MISKGPILTLQAGCAAVCVAATFNIWSLGAPWWTLLFPIVCLAVIGSITVAIIRH